MFKFQLKIVNLEQNCYRCRKIHPLLSLALQILHFERFLDSEYITLEDLDSCKTYLTNFNSQNNSELEINDKSTLDLLEKYEDYKKDTIDGKHGKTPQIFMLYVNLVNYYLIMEYSIRTADLNMYKYVLSKMANIYFIMNHQNYARYLFLYI